ncbi:MAG: AmmeMemoRadiSam system protein B [Treponema sp.]|jgi:AmmeMemoRadiSam system protein B|nr:AmmeMemoRadiSam system protein B [Treponema sp.]
MRIRDYSLPSGWYPRDTDEVSGFLSDFTSRGAARAAIAPHAGWYYSGRTAASAVSALEPQAKGLEPDAQTIAVLGGHLPAGSPPLFAPEDAFRTPFGSMPADGEIRSRLFKELDGEEDRYRDNTVEVLLPMVHFFFPKAKLLWLRLPAEIASFEAGKAIAEAAKKLNRKINILASTDLTHYGRNYGFSPRGAGEAALKWVKEVNDPEFLNAVQSGDAARTLSCAERGQSSCSPGAVLGAMGFAEAKGLGRAKLLEYATSADVQGGIPDSFVGYAAMAFGA